MGFDRLDFKVGGPVASHHTYRLFGLQVSSEVLLPAPQINPEPGEGPDCRVSLRRHTELPTHPRFQTEVKYHGDEGDLQCCVYEDAAATWICNFGVGVFRLTNEEITLFVHPEVDRALLGLMVTGQALILFLLRRGIPVIHGSCVLTEEGAVAFVGPKGQGKSTMAAHFLESGAALVSDDSFPVQMRPEPHAVPSLPSMKMWEDTEQNALRLQHALPSLIPGHAKTLMHLEDRYGYCPLPVRLQRIYLLDRRPEDRTEPTVEMHPVVGGDALSTLLSHLSWRRLLTPAQAGSLLPELGRVAAGTCLKRLTYVNGHANFPLVREAIRSDLAGSRSE